MKKVVPAFAVLAAVALFAWLARHDATPRRADPAPQHRSSGRTTLPQSGTKEQTSAADAFLHHANGVEVADEGRVVRILPDDQSGSRHQRFILRTASGPTVMIVHNIDLAPRVEPLRVGDAVAFQGEYVWNERGGVVHWTHHDPAARHAAGWIEHDGQTFR